MSIGVWERKDASTSCHITQELNSDAKELLLAIILDVAEFTELVLPDCFAHQLRTKNGKLDNTVKRFEKL